MRRLNFIKALLLAPIGIAWCKPNMVWATVWNSCEMKPDDILYFRCPHGYSIVYYYNGKNYIEDRARGLATSGDKHLINLDDFRPFNDSTTRVLVNK